MKARGSFEVELKPQEDAGFPAGRMLINKSYSGDLIGSGKGQMISKRTEGPSIYYAVEECIVTLDGKRGRFTLIHQGRMDKDSESLIVEILDNSGSGKLEGISGSMQIIRGDDGHSYELDYEL